MRGKSQDSPALCSVFLLQGDDGIWYVGRLGAEGAIQKAVGAALDKALGQIPEDMIRTADGQDLYSAVYAPGQRPVAGYSLSGTLGNPLDDRLFALTQRLYMVSTQLQPRNSDAHVIIAAQPAPAETPQHIVAAIHANPGVGGPQTDGPLLAVGAAVENGKVQIFSVDEDGASRAARRRQQRHLDRMNSKANAMNTNVTVLAAELIETILEACDE